MGDTDASFEVQIFLTEAEWKEIKPSHTLDGYEELNEAVDEAKLWQEAYQVVVIARGEDNDFEPGECVFDLQEFKLLED